MTGSPIPSPEPEVVAASRAWIAGAVLGPVVALALGIALFCIYIRRKPKLAEVDGEGQVEAKTAPKPPDAELDTNRNIAELPSQPPLAELEQPLAELESHFEAHSSRSDGSGGG